MSKEVLVVGAGPTGLMTALQLARHGVVPRIVDSNPTRSRHSKALAVHARTLEIFEDAGIVEDALAVGRRLHGMVAYSDKDRIAQISMDELDSPYPFILCVPQYETERLLEERAERHGVAVERDTTLLALERDAEGVEVTLELPNGRRETTHVDYVVGCDGAHSSVRHLVGASFEGNGIEGAFVFADLQLIANLREDEATAFFSSDGVVLCIPLPEPGRFRVIASVRDDQWRPEPRLEQFERAIATRTHLRAKLSDPIWMSGFTVKQRQVQSFRYGPVFLAGDAAHCHSPVGGQGMNTGLQDAYNLAWKLALVCLGAGRPELLDSYPPEREPVARMLLENTERGTRAVTLRNRVSREVRNRIVNFLSHFEVVQERLARTIGELDLNYRRSPIVREDVEPLFSLARMRNDSKDATLGAHRNFLAAPHAGDRAPDCVFEDGNGFSRLYELVRGPRHVLLIFSGGSERPDGYRTLAGIAERAITRFRAAIDVHIVLGASQPPEALAQAHSVVRDPRGDLHQRFGARAECLYLIRPDGYVGYRSQPAQWAPLEEHLSRILY